MKKLVILGIIALSLASCGVNVNQATRALEAQGIKNVQIGDYAFWGCGNDDHFHSSWTGTGQDGKPVSGTVCSGWLKGVTIRYD